MDEDMLLKVENVIRGGMCQSTYRYADANNKYIKDFDKNQESSHLEYLDSNQIIWMANR